MLSKQIQISEGRYRYEMLCMARISSNLHASNERSAPGSQFQNHQAVVGRVCEGRRELQTLQQSPHHTPRNIESIPLGKLQNFTRLQHQFTWLQVQARVKTYKLLQHFQILTYQ